MSFKNRISKKNMYFIKVLYEASWVLRILTPLNRNPLEVTNELDIAIFLV